MLTNSCRGFSGTCPKFLLILDDMGHVPTRKRRLELRFSIISNAYAHLCLVITANLELGRWGWGRCVEVTRSLPPRGEGPGRAPLGRYA
jgi:hypothetical protein